MTVNILNYRKSNHFLLKQWDRCIEDTFLYKVLPYIDQLKSGKNIIIAKPIFLNRKGIVMDSMISLVVVIKENLLITCYWCHNPEYLIKKEHNAFFNVLDI